MYFDVKTVTKSAILLLKSIQLQGLLIQYMPRLMDWMRVDV